MSLLKIIIFETKLRNTNDCNYAKITITMSELTGAEQVRWNLNDLYSSFTCDAFLNDKKSVLQEAKEFESKWKGKLAELTPIQLSQLFNEYELVFDKLTRLGSFVSLTWSTNTLDPNNGKALAEMNHLGSEVGQCGLFISVEWAQLSEDKIQEFVNSEELKPLRYYLEQLSWEKPHTLGLEASKVLVAKGQTSSAWVRYFDELLARATFDFRGEKLTEQEIFDKMSSADRSIRIDAADSITKTLKELSPSLTYIFNTLLQDKSINDTLLHFDSWVSSRHLANQTNAEAVDALIEAVVESYPLVQRYYRLKKHLLGLTDFYEYDRLAPILEPKQRIPWDEAKSIVIESSRAFDERIAQVVSEFFDKNWIDAAINLGKYSGAYASSSSVHVHPYVLMNYQGKMRDVQTLAHELGHGVHMYLSRKQGFFLNDTPLTTAETASVFSEMLVFQNLKSRIDDPKEKLALLIGKIDSIIATVHRQVSMNRFEHAAHTARREEGELTTEQYNEIWRKTQSDLYGEAISLRDSYDSWWSYIPHFLHTPGYVYAYAFGELLVLSLYELYKQGVEGFADNYVELLSAGGSDKPENLIAPFGFDIKTKEFWKQGTSVIQAMIEEAEQLAKQAGYEY